MQNANDDEREELLNKFKNIKEAYEVLSDADKRKLYDAGDVKPPPGGWYVDLDAKILASLQSRAVGGVGRGGIFRGGIIAGGGGIGGVAMRGMNPRGMPMRAGNPIIRGNTIFFFLLYSILLHMPPLGFHCVGGCWDRTQDCVDFGIGSQTF